MTKEDYKIARERQWREHAIWRYSRFCSGDLAELMGKDTLCGDDLMVARNILARPDQSYGELPDVLKLLYGGAPLFRNLKGPP